MKAYEKAYAEAKANALEVGNYELISETIKNYAEVLHGITVRGFAYAPNVEYDWPGSAVIKDGKYILNNMSNNTMAFSFGISMIVLGVIFLIACYLVFDQRNKIHAMPEDPPIRLGSYLTWITIKKTILENQGDTMIVQDYAETSRWEVLEFNPDFKSAPKWNTLHLNDGEVIIHCWTELPSPQNSNEPRAD